MTSLVKKIINLVFYFVFLIRVKNIKYTVFDLDNTLYDTWKYIDINSQVDYSNIPIFTGMKKKVINESLGSRILFLSARNIWTYNQTKKRLRRDFNNMKFDLVLVSKPIQKLKYIRYLVSKSKLLKYYDDLSYNHEKGDIRFYEKIISSIKSIGVEYIDYNKINEINAK